MGSTVRVSDTFVLDVLDEWLGSGPYPLWRTYDVDGYRFSIKRDYNGKLLIQREHMSDED